MIRTKGSSIWKRRQRGAQKKLSNLATKLNPNDPNWIDRYVEVSTHLSFGDIDKSWFEDVHLDILRDICNEDLHSDYILHLLTLLELMVPFLDSEDKIEQTVGSLLNIVKGQSGSRTSLVMNKYIITATSLVIYTQEWRFHSKSILDLFNAFVTFLVEKSEDIQSSLYETCLDSLSEISSSCPELLEISNYQPPTLAKNLTTLLDTRQNATDLRDLAQNISCFGDIKFHNFSVNSGRFTNSLSLMTLKPYLHQFISSNSIHNLHLALRLLIKYGFEIFSSLEEEYLMKQMVTLSTLPSLPIGYRLLMLSFIKIAFVSIYKPPLNSPPLGLINSLCPYLFDGPDTQEKKMTILNEFSFVISDSEFFNLISRLHSLSNSQCTNYNRATRSLFRVLNASLKKRPQLMERIFSNVILESIFSLSYVHYIEKLFVFLCHHWDFAQLTVDKFIAKLMINQSAASGSQNALAQSYSQYLAFLQLINWFLSLAHHHIVLTEFQLEFLVNFIRINCLHWPQSSTHALICCTSILYYQRVTPKVKEALLNILEWLKGERQMDMETSSLAQIYLLALRTLKEEYIKQVFTSDEEEFRIQTIPESFDDYLRSIVRNDDCQCPLRVARVNEASLEHRLKVGNPLWLTVPFQVYLDESSQLERLFCVDILFTSAQLSQFKQAFQLPFVEKRGNQEAIQLTLTLDFKISSPFLLDVNIRFVDYTGTIYNFTETACEFFSLEDTFIGIDLPDQVTIHSLAQSLLKHNESLQTVICLREERSFDSFFEHFPWMRQFVIASEGENAQEEEYNLTIGLPPDRAIVGTIRLVNDFINLYITTNHYEILPSLLQHTFACGNSKQMS